jgi:hypothetical protein
MKQIARRGAALAPTAQMKRLAAAAVAVAALASISVALAGGGALVGQYKTKITSPPEAKGTWILKFANGGSYTVIAFGHPFIRGKYSATGSKITFGHETGQGACAKPGTYTWKKSGKTLKFTRVNDPAVCSGRSGVLAHPFTQQS